MLPHLGQARIWPIASALRTRRRVLQVTQVIENGSTRERSSERMN
jgi:hypothetical protein